MTTAATQKNGRRRRRIRQAGQMSEINVTPLVDVMLVLLIVFMVAAPLLTAGVPIDLPKTGAGAMQPEGKPVMITIAANGEIFLNDEQVVHDKVVGLVTGLLTEKKDQRIYIRGDLNAQYGAVMRVMGDLSGAGYSQIGLITDKQQSE